MFYVGVIGAGTCSSEIYNIALNVGKELAENNALVLCGGYGGVMEAVAKGVHNKSGTVVGILPGTNKEEGNSYLTFSLATGLGEARNAVITRASDVLIAISGGSGILSEIGLALKMGKKVIGLQTWGIIPPGYDKLDFYCAESSTQAVMWALETCKQG